MNQQFFNLPDEKQNTIIQTCIEEFTKYGFENASTNRIVKNAGISKGSLFKYFGNKEQLYFYILDISIEEVYIKLKDKIDIITEKPQDLMSRVRELVETSLDINTEIHKKFRLFLVFMNDVQIFDSDKLAKKYAKIMRDIFMKIFRNIKKDNLRVDFEKAITMIKWIVIALKNRAEFMPNLAEDPIKLKAAIMEKLDLTLNGIKHGLYKKNRSSE